MAIYEQEISCEHTKHNDLKLEQTLLLGFQYNISYLI